MPCLSFKMPIHRVIWLSVQTNVGLTRALIEVLKHKADLINLSYGEATATPNIGRFVDLTDEVGFTHLEKLIAILLGDKISHQQALQIITQTSNDLPTSLSHCSPARL